MAGLETEGRIEFRAGDGKASLPCRSSPPLHEAPALKAQALESLLCRLGSVVAGLGKEAVVHPRTPSASMVWSWPENPRCLPPINTGLAGHHGDSVPQRWVGLSRDSLRVYLDMDSTSVADKRATFSHRSPIISVDKQGNLSRACKSVYSRANGSGGRSAIVKPREWRIVRAAGRAQ